MSEANNNRSIDIELQVRLMNLVMGEASDFERDQLQMLMEQRPELVAYYQHVEHLHGLLNEVGAGELEIDVDTSTPEDVWQLPADRRVRVLAVLDNRNPSPPEKVTLANKKWPKNWRVTALEAVVVASIACVLIGLMFPAVQSSRVAARRFSARGGTTATFLSDSAPSATPDLVPLSSMLFDGEQVASPGSPNVDYMQPSRILGMSGQEDRSTPNSFAESPRAIVPDWRRIQIRNQPLPVPYYLSDDVQYFPASPENKPGSETTTSPATNEWAIRQDQQRNSVAQSNSGGSSANEGYDAASFGDMGGRMPSVVKGRAGYGGRESDYGRSDEKLGDGISPSFGLQTADSNESNPLSNAHGNYPRFSLGGVVNDFDAQKQVDHIAVPAKRNTQWSDNGIANNFGTDSDTPVTDEARWKSAERSKSQALEEVAEVAIPNVSEFETETTYTVMVPDDGTIMLGGIRRNREGRTEQGESFSSTLMMTVTPRIIIPEEDEEILRRYDVTDFNRASQLAGGQVQTLRQSAIEWEEKSVVENSEGFDQIVKVLEDGSETNWSKDTLSPLIETTNTPEAAKSAAHGKSKQDSAARAIDAPQPTFSDIALNLPSLKALSSEVGAEDYAGIESLARINKSEVNRGRNFTPAPSPRIAVDKELGYMNSDVKRTAPKQPVTLDEQSATAEAFSTFSLHVSDVSFKLAQAALGQGLRPEAAKIRIEEFVNALDYHDPLPSGNQRVACRVEQAIHPFLMQRNLLRVSMRTAATGRSRNTSLRLTLLLDNSGSMERPDRRQAVLRAFQTLISQLNAADQVTLISFASRPRLLADKVPGNQSETLLKLIESLPSEGGTNIEAALSLAREKAVEQQLAGAQNRIVLLTDGAVNLGNANPESLAKLVAQLRDAGIAFDAAGICAQDLNDEVLEALTRQGDGRYYLLDSAEAAGEIFAAQIAGALRPSAQNVKVQVEFNPQRVGRYKLLGFEKHRLNKEDFRDDQVDAAEMAAAEAGVAVYQFEIKPNGSGDVGSVSVRFRDLSTGQMIERRWPILYESNTPRLEQAQASMQLAASAALFAAKLSGGPLADSVDLAQLQKLLSNLSEQCANQPRVQQLRSMIEQAKAIGH